MRQLIQNCPFCGSISQWSKTGRHRLVCSNPGCNCEGPTAPDQIHAINGWNKRSNTLSYSDAIDKIAKTVRNTLADMEFPPKDGDAQIDEVLRAIYKLKYPRAPS